MPPAAPGPRGDVGADECEERGGVVAVVGERFGERVGVCTLGKRKVALLYSALRDGGRGLGSLLLLAVVC